MLRRWTAVLQIIVLALSILFSGMLPSRAFAASNSLVVYQLQTGATNAATQEFISLYNISDQPLDVSGWCVIYASSSDVTQTQLGCFAPPSTSTKLMLPSHKAATLASAEFNAAHLAFVPDILFTAGVSGTSGHVRVVDSAKHEVDVVGWGSAVHPETAAVAAHATGKILQRILPPDGILQDTDNNAADFFQTTLTQLPSTSIEEEVIQTDACPNVAEFQTTIPDGYLLDASGNCQQDVCENLAGLQLSIPDKYMADGVDCVLVPLESSVLEITELLPNVSGSDTGKEFIELFNPNNHSVSLEGYVLETGTDYTKSYTLPSVVIASMQYLSLSDTETGIVLPNTLGLLRLRAPSGDIVSVVAGYENPKEDMAWAKVGNDWSFTNTPTPDAENVLSSDYDCIDCETAAQQTDDELTPCRADQERNPETNRCRLIQAVATSLAPCKPGQERSPDTNRCRSIVNADVSSLVPCKEGQERNPETNRCKAIAQPAVLGACDEGEERNPETNRCRKIASGAGAGNQLAKIQDVNSGSISKNPRWWIIIAAVIAAVGYAAFEWRNEVGAFIKRFAPIKKT